MHHRPIIVAVLDVAGLHVPLQVRGDRYAVDGPLLTLGAVVAVAGYADLITEPSIVAETVTKLDLPHA